MATITMAILLVCLLKTALCTTTSTVENFERDWNIALADLTTEDKMLGKDNIAAYAKCHDISNTERECTLTYEFLHPDGFIFKNKCHVRFQNDKGMKNLNIMKIRLAERGKVVISYINGQERKEPIWATAYTVYRVIDTSTCKYYEAKVLFNTTQLSQELGDAFWKGNVFLNEDGTFDTFLAQKDLCKGARCRVTFGPDGKMVRNPASYLSKKILSNEIEMFPFAKTSKYNEFYAVMKEQAAMNPELKDVKILRASADSTNPDTVLDLSDLENFDVDNSQGVLGICWSSKIENLTTIECRQYNNVNEVTVSAFFELPYNVKTLKVKNTWAGEELLLLTDECEDDLCENDGRYYIRAINRRKPHSGNMEISGLNCSGNKKDVAISVFNKKSKDDKICVSAFCQNFERGEPGKSYNNIKFVRQCFLTKYINEAL